MDLLNGMTKMSSLCRQLAVLVLLNWAGPALAQGSASVRSSVISGTMTYPGLNDNAPNKFYVSNLTVTDTKRDTLYFADLFVNPDLSLGVKHTYDFDFNFNQQNGKGNAPVPDGYYMLTIATFIKAPGNFTDPRIPKDFTLKDRFVTVNDPTVIRVVGGQKHLTVSLRFTNPTQASVTNALYVEFKPLTCPAKTRCLEFHPDGEVNVERSRLIEFKGNYKPYIFSTTWVPSQRVAAGKTDPNAKRSEDEVTLGQGLRDFAQSVQTERDNAYAAMKKGVVSPQQYAFDNKLTLIDFDDPRLYAAGQKFMKEDIRQIIYALLRNNSARPISLPDSKRPMLSAFCDVITQLNAPKSLPAQFPVDYLKNRASFIQPLVRDCQNKLDLLHMRRNFHVGHVNSNVPAVSKYMRPSANVVMNNYASTRSHDESASSIWNFKIMHLFGSVVLPAVGAITVIGKSVLGNLPVDYTHTVTTSNARGRNEAAIMSNQEGMDVVSLIADFAGHNVTSCLEVKMVPAKPNLLFNPMSDASNGFYVCQKLGTSINVQEVYMTAVSNMKNTPLTTAYDLHTQALNWVGRGDGEIADFYRDFRESLSPLPNTEALGGKNWATWYTETATRYLSQRSKRAANVVTTPVAFHQENTLPSFAGKIFGWYEEKF